MSSKSLTDLLDSMLDESETRQEAEEVQAREARERKAAAPPQAASAPPKLENVVQLTGLTEPDLRKVLEKAAPDDLLVVVASADEALQRRILRNLSEDSVRWLRANLAHIDHVNDHERDQARHKLLGVANRLLVAGDIGLPEPEAIGADEAPDPERKELRELLVDLVKIAEQAGPAALSEIAASAGEPLLRDGLPRVVAGADADALRSDLGALRNELEQRYAQRLKWMVEALVAIAEGETAESFAKRVFGK